MSEARVYLDWNATAPPLADVIDACGVAMRDAWANPQSVHGDGRTARKYVEDARKSVGELMLRDPRDVIFTSGATEANNIALRSAFATKKGLLITSTTEHPSIVRVAEALEREGLARVAWLPVRSDGTLDFSSLEEWCDRARGEAVPCWVTISVVNHETGVIHPVRDVSARARSLGAHVHFDATQAAGKIAFDPALGDTIAIAAHKMRGPKGVGALAFRPGIRIEPVLRGGAQERGLRPGTVDPVLCAGFGVAAKYAQSGRARYAEVASRRDAFEQRVIEGVAGSFAPARNVLRAPHVASLVLSGFNGPEIVAALDLEGVSVSSGSACSAGTSEPSAVIAAMLGKERAVSAIRVSMGDITTEAELARAADAFVRVTRR